MAEPLNSTSLVPASPSSSISADQYLIRVKEFDAAGKATELTIPLPSDPDFNKWGLMQQVIMLKKGMWSKSSVPEVIWGLAYAHSIGADVMKGDLFPTGEGRWGTSNKFKIRKAMQTGLITGIDVQMKDTGKPLNCPGADKCVLKSDLECTVTLEVKGFSKPIVKRSTLSRWFKATNPNWCTNPEHMLELNTKAHACEDAGIGLGATENDEAPPVVAEIVTGQQSDGGKLLDQLKESVAQAKAKKGVSEPVTIESSVTGEVVSVT